jgi:hypothetical protein
MNLFVYGDSNTIDDFEEPRTYLHRIKDHFDLVAHNYSCDGSSLDYTQVSVSETSHEWLPNDIVIVVLTQKERAWVIQDNPSCTNYTFLSERYKNRPELLNHIDWYFGEVKNHRVDEALRNNFIQSLSYLVDHKKIRSLVLFDAFPQKAKDTMEMPSNILYSQTGYYGEISLREGKPSYRGDHRRNHINFDNHEIFADKIISAIENKRNFYI